MFIFRQKHMFILQLYIFRSDGGRNGTETLVGRRDAGLVDGTYVNENNI